MKAWTIAAVAVGAGAALLLTRRSWARGGEDVPERMHYAPHSPEAQALFAQAARYTGLPERWAYEPAIHNLMDAESSGWLGRPSYAFSNVIPGIHHVSQAHRWPAEIWAPLRAGNWEMFDAAGRCKATGLGQMCRDKMDLFPDGAQGIGNPLNEAVAFFRYVAQRYGDPETAYRFHRLPRCSDENEALIRSQPSRSNMIQTAFSLGCKHHEGY